MDVGNPSNFARLLHLFGNDHAVVRDHVSGFSINDAITLQVIREVYEKNHYLCDPHGAVAYYHLQKHLEQHPGRKGIFLETAHPAKFDEVVSAAIGAKIEMPPAVRELLKKEKQSVVIPAEYDALKEFLFYKEVLVQ